MRPTLPSLAVQDSDSLTVFAGQGTDLTMASTYAPVLGNETAAAALKRALMGVEPLLEETGLVRLVLAGTVSKPHGHSLAFDRLAEFTP